MTQEKKNDEFVNITDCLEAIGAFKAMKNFLFFVVFIAMILLGTCFVLSDLGIVSFNDATAVSAGAVGPVEDSKEVNKVSDNDIVEEIASTANTAAATVAKAVQKVIAEPNNQLQKQSQPLGDSKNVKVEDSGTWKFQISFAVVAAVVRGCNFVLIISASLYCLVLMFSLKVSLVGRLGGINHIARAFFNSLFLLVFIFPWQKFLTTSVVTGAVYLPDELKTAVMGKGDITTVALVFYYLRFILWWTVALLLLLAAQRRSARWANATLRRLGIEQ